MTKLFGLPIDSLMYGLLAALAAGIIALLITALRNPVLFKTGVRNITRRPAQTSLIVLGLMLATVLFSSALVTGDTMNYSIKKTAVDSLGATDVLVEVNGRTTANAIIGTKTQARDTYFSPAVYKDIKDALVDKDLIDGITPVIKEQAPAVSPASKQSVPDLTVLGVENAYTKQMAPLVTKTGVNLSLSKLGPKEVYLNQEAADKLYVKKGDKVNLFIGALPFSATVKGIFQTGGEPSTGPGLVMSLAKFQRIAGQTGKINTILISGKGDEIEGAKPTSKILKEVKPILQGTHLEAKSVKKDTLKDAESAAASFMSIFLIFGQFGMIAGVMLIFLIFVMLAAERKTELGVLRALGSKRRDILKMFTFEGAVYAVLSAAVGSVVGLGVGWGMVKILAAAFGKVDMKLTYHLEPKSFLIAYAMGVITTFLVVFLSAWRVGRINIVRAIRDLPEPTKSGRSVRSLLFSVGIVVAGFFMASSALKAEQLSPFMIGTTLVIIGLPLLARFFRLPDRAAFTLAGIGVLVWWLLPEGTAHDLFGIPEMKAGIEMFFISGISVVLGAVWAVMYNSDILLAIIVAIFGRLKGMPPMLKIAVNYPMRSRFRTGMALAMFALIIFTMTFMGTIIKAVGSVYENTPKLTGGFEIQGITGYANPVVDPRQSMDDHGSGIKSDDVKTIGSFSMAGVEMRQENVRSKKWTPYALQGVNDGYADHTTYGFSFRSSDYRSDREVWEALINERDVAVVHDTLVPVKTNYTMGNTPPAFRLSGFYLEDKKLPEDIYIEVRNPSTGAVSKLRVIGVIENTNIYATGGVFTSQQTVNEVMSAPIPATVYWFKLKPGVNASKASRALAKTFYENGMSTTVLRDSLDKLMQTNIMINRLLQGFMGLGLIVGIAALGVIAARSVVERRRQIGMLRAIGFRTGMVKSTFIIESSFIALLGIALGSALGLSLSYVSMATFEKQIPGMTFSLPWGSVLVTAAIAYAASLLTTYMPAQQASKVYPAEALRYE